MFEVYFYKFSKKLNSTKEPDAAAIATRQTFNCYMKEPSTITAPVIQLKLDQSTVPDYNYCYIPALGQRYYQIMRVYWDGGFWAFELSVDVLATYRGDIRSSSQYVLRSTKVYDPNLIDTFYLTKLSGSSEASQEVSYYQGYTDPDETVEPYGIRCRTSTGSTIFISNYFDRTFENGRVVLGVLGNNASGVVYYSMNMTTFKSVIQKAFALSPSAGDITQPIANAIYSPIQYITSCRWYPSVEDSGTAVTTMYIGGMPISGLTNCTRLNNSVRYTYTGSITIPKNTDSDTYPYLNMSPFAEYSLYFQPFGLIPLDTTKLYGATDLYFDFDVDYCTGACTLKLKNNDANAHQTYNAYDNCIFFNTYEYGVELPISTLTTDWKAGAVVSGLSFLKSVVTGSTVGGVSSDVQAARDYVASHPEEYEPGFYEKMVQTSTKNTELIDTAINTVAASMGQVQSVGSIGSFLAYNAQIPRIYAFFYRQTQPKPDKFGRPAYQYSPMTALTDGFVLCADAYVDYSIKTPTASESAAVSSFLNSGIYLE